MMVVCNCGSYAINDRAHGRTIGDRLNLCDVCYWRDEAETLNLALAETERLLREEKRRNDIILKLCVDM